MASPTLLLPPLTRSDTMVTRPNSADRNCASTVNAYTEQHMQVCQACMCWLWSRHLAACQQQACAAGSYTHLLHGAACICQAILHHAACARLQLLEARCRLLLQARHK